MKKRTIRLLFLMGTKNYKIIFILLLTIFVSAPSVIAQKQSEKLKKKQKELQRKIENTKKLLGTTQSETKVTIAELAIINQQIAYRDELITNYSHQVNKINAQIQQHNEDIDRMQTELGKLKKRYVELVRYAYRHRNNYHRLLYVFASGSFNQAYLRVKYLGEFADHRKKQAQQIRKKQRDLALVISALKNDKNEKQELLGEQKSEKEHHLTDKQKQQESLNKLKSEEAKIKDQLSEQKKQKELLDVEIKKAIEEEIRKERERERERQAKNNAKKNNSNNSSTSKTTTTTAKKHNYNVDTPNIEPESAEFEKNRGHLPWPVEKGEITSHFGRNPHPTLAGVVTNNNGVDIGTTKSAAVRSVFHGKVTSVFVIPNAGKCVIVSHGAYRTVYANLASVNVKKGDEVKTKQTIGTLLPNEEGNLSEAHFEIWKVTSSDMEKQNPGLWLYR